MTAGSNDKIEEEFFKFNDFCCKKLTPITVDDKFLEFLRNKDSELYKELITLRQDSAQQKDFPSDIIIELSTALEAFIKQQFREISLPPQKENLEKFIQVKHNFIRKVVVYKYQNSEPSNNWEDEITFISEESFINKIDELSKSPTSKENDTGEVLKLEKYAAWAMFSKEGQRKHKNSLLFSISKKIDPSKRFDFTENTSTSPNEPNFITSPLRTNSTEPRGFNLTNTKNSEQYNAWHNKYCIYCHKTEKDYCRSGLPNNEKLYPDFASKTGCPLKQKISESHLTKSTGYLIAPLAIIMIDNPLCILTGYRICNDCSESCIFQKQEPVDIPSLESQILLDVLKIKYGFEVYYLLTQWNPLKRNNYIRAETGGDNYNGLVAVAGCGPAGISASYYMLYHGYKVVCFDGLNLKSNEHNPLKAIENISDILDYPLSKRKPKGFGGVMEYGITVRWNKNFLDLARIILERQKGFSCFGNMRLGSSIDCHYLFNKINIDHLFVAVGAGRPNMLKHSLGLYANIITSSDFLMRLHSNGYFLHCNNNSTNGLEPLIPKINKGVICIVGGGLTAMDVACEAKAYYEATHSSPIRVVIIYRKTIQESKAYTNNYLELQNTLKEGVEFMQEEIIEDLISLNNKTISEIILKSGKRLEVGFIISAIGTSPNIKPLKEMEIGQFASPRSGKNYAKNISLLGDCNPLYEGSIVKALASAKDEAERIVSQKKIKKISAHKGELDSLKFANKIIEKCLVQEALITKDQFSEMLNLKVISNTLSKVVKPGQIIRVALIQNNNLEMSGYTPLTIAHKDGNNLEFIVRIVGFKTERLSKIKVGDEISLMNSHTFESVSKEMFNIPQFEKFDLLVCDEDKLPIFEKISRFYGTKICNINDDICKVLLDLGNANANALVATTKYSLVDEKISEFNKYTNSAGRGGLYMYLFTKMNCMLKGVCSRCINRTTSGEIFYACENPIVPCKMVDIATVERRNAPILVEEATESVPNSN